jgi:hypothetical protein
VLGVSAHEVVGWTQAMARSCVAVAPFQEDFHASSVVGLVFATLAVVGRCSVGCPRRMPPTAQGLRGSEVFGLPLHRREGQHEGALDAVGTKLSAAEIREWIVDPVGMAAKHKATRKPVMTAKYATLPKEDLDAARRVHGLAEKK